MVVLIALVEDCFFFIFFFCIQDVPDLYFDIHIQLSLIQNHSLFSFFGFLNRPLDSCNGMLTFGELGFSYLPDYFACNI